LLLTIIVAIVDYKNEVEQKELDSALIEFYNFPSNNLIDTNYFILNGKISDSTIKLDVALGKLISYSNGKFNILLERRNEDAEDLLDINLTKGNAVRNFQKNIP